MTPRVEGTASQWALVPASNAATPCVMVQLRRDCTNCTAICIPDFVCLTNFSLILSLCTRCAAVSQEYEHSPRVYSKACNGQCCLWFAWTSFRRFADVYSASPLSSMTPGVSCVHAPHQLLTASIRLGEVCRGYLKPEACRYASSDAQQAFCDIRQAFRLPSLGAATVAQILQFQLCLQGLAAFIVTDAIPSEEDLRAAATNNEIWSTYPDSNDGRTQYPGDTRAALAPLLAHRALRGRYRCSCMGMTIPSGLQMGSGTGPEA